MPGKWPIESRTYARNVRASQANMSPDSIREAKNARAHRRNMDRKAVKHEVAIERFNAHNRLTIAERIEKCKGRPGQSNREMARLLAS